MYHGNERNIKLQQGCNVKKEVSLNATEAAQAVAYFERVVMLRVQRPTSETEGELPPHIYRKLDDNTWKDEGKSYIPDFRVRGIASNGDGEPGPYINFCTPYAEDISLRMVYGLERPFHVTKVNTVIDSGTDDLPIPDTTIDVEIILAG